MDQFARGSEVARTTRVLERHLDGVRSLDVVLEAAPGTFTAPAGVARLAEVSAWLRTRPGVLRATSLVDWLLEARRVVRGEDEVGEARFASDREIAALRRILVVSGDLTARDPTERLVSWDAPNAKHAPRILEIALSRRRIPNYLEWIEAIGDRRAILVKLEIHPRFSVADPANETVPESIRLFVFRVALVTKPLASRRQYLVRRGVSFLSRQITHFLTI